MLFLELEKYPSHLIETLVGGVQYEVPEVNIMRIDKCFVDVFGARNMINEIMCLRQNAIGQFGLHKYTKIRVYPESTYKMNVTEGIQ